MTSCHISSSAIFLLLFFFLHAKKTNLIEKLLVFIPIEKKKSRIFFHNLPIKQVFMVYLLTKSKKEVRI